MGKEMIDRLSVRVLQADEIKTLHREWLTRDFPPEEQKPLSMIMNAVERDAYICYGAMAEESMLNRRDQKGKLRYLKFLRIWNFYVEGQKLKVDIWGWKPKTV